MRIFIENVYEKKELPIENSKLSLKTYNNCLIVELSSGEETKYKGPNEEKILRGDGEFRFPIIWGKENDWTCLLRTKNQTVKLYFSLSYTDLMSEDDINNLCRFSDQMDSTFQIGKKYLVQDLYEAIKNDNVELIVFKKPFVGYDDQSLLNRIKETVPMVMDICSHPKQSLRTEEAVLEVNLVKRINSRTMDHLSSHSEHWKARTLNGLIPNRLRADIFEDEINIYENLFFRMAVDEILNYIHHQVVSLEKTIQQNDNAIDWNSYGNELFDYKRMRVFEQLLPDYNVSERKDENNSLKDLLLKWQKLEKHFSTIEASQFYRSIDSKKHISRNIKPTNILKKDSRYNALYRLWCDILHQKAIENDNSQEIRGIGGISLSDSYSTYVIVLLLYIFKLLECDIQVGSSFEMQGDGLICVNANFEREGMNYTVSTRKNKFGNNEVVLRFTERRNDIFVIPTEAQKQISEIEKNLPKCAEINKNQNSIIFHSNPTEEEKNTLKKAFSLGKAAKKGISKEEARQKHEIDEVWRKEIGDYFISGAIKESRSEEIIISPQNALIQTNENAINEYTTAEFNGAWGNTVFILPIDIREFHDLATSNKLINRLLNYGEKYIEEDALAWGNYKIGLIPIGLTEINSAQRLMKLVSIHTSRLLIRWRTEQVICPICGSDNCIEESKDNWKCNNSECGVLFGVTKHDSLKGGCGRNYEWIRPYINIKKDNIPKNDLDCLLKKELIFDRLTITDFDFKVQPDNRIRYIPVCPLCGKR